jgi:hypothetical protein
MTAAELECTVCGREMTQADQNTHPGPPDRPCHEACCPTCTAGHDPLTPGPGQLDIFGGEA